MPAFEVRLAGAVAFPPRRARVIALDLAPHAPLAAAAEALERAAVACGFEPERRPFRPHLTLGRFKHSVPRPKLPELDLGRTTLRTLTLFQSELRPDGAVYTPLERYALRGR